MVEDASGLARLIYTSEMTQRLPYHRLTAELDEILAVSQRNNRRAGVTGALVCFGDCFAQVLEGPTDAVLSTYQRISQDPRHRQVTQLHVERIETRMFKDWSMAFAGGDEQSVSQSRSGAASPAFDRKLVDAATILDMLQTLSCDNTLRMSAA